MTEWTDPRYASVLAALRRAQQARTEDQRPLRGFLTPQDK